MIRISVGIYLYCICMYIHTKQIILDTVLGLNYRLKFGYITGGGARNRNLHVLYLRG